MPCSGLGCHWVRDSGRAWQLVDVAGPLPGGLDRLPAAVFDPFTVDFWIYRSFRTLGAWWGGPMLALDVLGLALVLFLVVRWCAGLAAAAGDGEVD